ncbi:crotonase/enoyl-CoA hydratase family protein [Alterisphingorhabdus coralli]|uniref:Crotonase/enoyl-CoA hydratase family protein n=1 Tax=Alterisphingorhabdus coralli TaxID=3071408 RepID=A0AA97I0H3_9SPHN|nr:crotonase/enoyl-CoA hydratase family protein [Parasphingorhabdus sp. SCSIO 66989]WOE73760.1 crotonase/enoyl-CoA hydratase family protein [Parasphingorhabdus sp. SCSIO 66989]
MTIQYETRDTIAVVTIDRPERRNAVDMPTSQALYDAFKQFDADEALSVAVLTGAGDAFCAGADLRAISEGEKKPVREEGDFAPMGPTRLRLSKPVIAAVEGPAVAGGLELALWADLRVAAQSSVFGVYCRRFGVPLIDLGTIRLPRLIGQSRASDMILTGRGVGAEEAHAMGLANRVVADGEALDAAIKLASEIAAFPQLCMRNDRLSMFEQWDMREEEALKNEIRRGLETIESGETLSGATAFAGGKGRHGEFG